MILYNTKFLDNVDIFTSKEIKLLEDLNKKVSLEYFLSNKSFIDKFGMDFIHTSAKIEGNTYDKKDTLALLEYGRTAGGKRYSDAKMILNLKAAYDFFIAKKPKADEVTLKELHYILSDEMMANNERAMPRDESVAIRGSEYIPLSSSLRLHDELKHMFKKYEEIDNSFNRAIYLHCNLAYLQYFKDCNKRTARMMLNVSLSQDNKMLYIPNEETIKEYLDSIITYYETGKYDKFKSYFINEYKRTTDNILQIIDAKEQETLSNSKIRKKGR